MTKAKWLLTHHTEHLFKLRILEAQLEHQQAYGTTKNEKDDAIEALALAHPPLDLPTTAYNGTSKTEHIMMNYEKELSSDISSTTALLAEIGRLRYYLQIYDALMTYLTEEQAWIVRCKYVEGKSYGDMLKELPSSILVQSENALWKRGNRILIKLDKLLDHSNLCQDSQGITL